jgi:hypothetical protein
MNLNDAQQKTVAEWVAGGMKLAEVQTRIASEFGLQLTYMERNFIGDGCLEPENRGLTHYGIQVVRDCNRLLRVLRAALSGDASLPCDDGRG